MCTYSSVISYKWIGGGHPLVSCDITDELNAMNPLIELKQTSFQLSEIKNSSEEYKD